MLRDQSSQQGRRQLQPTEPTVLGFASQTSAQAPRGLVKTQIQIQGVCMGHCVGNPRVKGCGGDLVKSDGGDDVGGSMFTGSVGKED